jgi:undecaprenyl-diphosphatase
MTIVDGLILGILQGITEFIPVSSSGHLVLAQHFMGLQASPEFDALINLGTFLALLVFFRKRISTILIRIFRHHDYRLARNILITAIPVGLAGLFFAKFFEQEAIQNPLMVAIMLLIVGIVMVAIDKLPRLSDVESEEKMSSRRALIIGIGQMFALIPGVSRSGSSIIAGRLVGLDFFKAAEYSFLVSIPVMAGVILKGFISHDSRQFIQDNLGVYIVSNIAAFACGLLAVGFMINYLKKGNFKIFGYYRIGLALLVLVVLAFAH